MATIQEVLGMLIPNGGYVATGDTYEGIVFIEADPITKVQFEAGFAQFDEYKAEQETAQAAADKVATDAKASRDAKLAKMGFTLAEIENW